MNEKPRNYAQILHAARLIGKRIATVQYDARLFIFFWRTGDVGIDYGGRHGDYLTLLGFSPESFCMDSRIPVNWPRSIRVWPDLLNGRKPSFSSLRYSSYIVKLYDHDLYWGRIFTVLYSYFICSWNKF